jgi:hypothetical protein
MNIRLWTVSGHRNMPINRADVNSFLRIAGMAGLIFAAGIDAFKPVLDVSLSLSYSILAGVICGISLIIFRNMCENR